LTNVEVVNLDVEADDGWAALILGENPSLL